MMVLCTAYFISVAYVYFLFLNNKLYYTYNKNTIKIIL